MYITRYLLVAVLSAGLGACSVLPGRGSSGAKEPGAPTATSEVEASPRATPEAPSRAEAESQETAEVETPPAAAAKARVAIVVEGSKAKDIGKAIETMLGERYDVIPSDRYQKTAKRLKAKKMKDRDVVKVASKLDADAVLHVVLGRKKKKRYKLALNLRDGSTGKILDTFDLLLKAQRLAGDDQRQLADKLMPQIDALASAPAPAQAEEPAPVVDTSASDDRDRVIEKPRPAKSERGRLLDVKTDNRGQVIDDEVPKTHSR